MGGKPAIVYSVEVPNQPQPANSTKVRRHPRCIDGLRDCPSNGLQTMKQIFEASFHNFSDNTCLGTIVHNLNGQKSIAYETYSEVKQKVNALGAAINEFNLSPTSEEVPGLKMRLVGIYSKNCADWLLVDIACCMFGLTSVPLYETLNAEALTYALNHSGIQVLFCSEACCNTLVKVTKLAKLRTVIQFGRPSPELINAYKSRKITLLSFETLIEKGSMKRAEYVNVKPEQCSTFSYTSGTTGQVKAVMLSHRNFASVCGVVEHNTQAKLFASDVYLSYLPLSHILERMSTYNMLAVGASICFYSGNVEKLTEDIQLVRPTMFCSVPRFYTKVYEKVKERFQQAKGCSKSILEASLSAKLENVNSKGEYRHWLYDKLVFDKTKALMGGRVRFMLTGSAPILPHVHSFIKIIASCPVLQGYGLTECTGGSCITDANDPATGNVGGPTSNVQIKLEDIPEMGYTHMDRDEKGQPQPRGEVCFRGPGIFLGYYKDPEKTKEALDKDGWFHSGDVGAFVPGNGALKIIDRKKNIFKLQQGEYIVVEEIELVYSKRPEVAEIFLHGDSNQSFCIAIIVPKQEVIQSMGKQFEIKGKFEYLCTHPRIRKQLLTQLDDFAKEEGLATFQRPRNVYLEPVSFQAKGLLTSTMKFQRHAARKMYAGQINAMYREGDFLGKEK